MRSIPSRSTSGAGWLRSSLPLFVLLCSWVLEREKATARQVLGMLISLGGIVVIMSRGAPASLLHLEIHAGDAWILLALPMWGLYSVLLKRAPAALRGVAFLFAISLLGTAMLVPFYALQLAVAPVHHPGGGAGAGGA
ncbi:MAG: hypothetical protein ACT4P4_18825 [Betaproteobacteria bacterium]